MAKPEASQTFGISLEELKCVVSDKHRNEIAKKVGGDWESLATFIGVSSEEVDDIKEEYRKPMDRRLAMMRRWHKLWVEKATYHRLVEGLKEIGRRDLIDLFKQDTQLQSASESKSLLKHQISYDPRSSWEKVEIKLRSASLIVIFFALFFGTLKFIKPRYNYDVYNIIPFPYNISGTDQQHLINNITAHQLKIVANHQQARNCSSPESDLPIIHPLFVGRENDVHQVLLRVARAHIVNVNGAPGFGKSTLAIHVGYEVVKNGTSVRYKC